MAANNTSITMLVENDALECEREKESGKAQLTSEHGLSMLIEADGQRILLDTGQGPALQVNVPLLDVDLAEVDALALSHGHYDHSGGLPYALANAKRARVYCHPAVLETRYSVVEGTARSIGIPETSHQALEALPSGSIDWVLGPTRLSDNIGLTGPVPRLTEYEDTGGPFYLDETGWRPDPLEDDMALWIRTAAGLVVCLGCAHAGVVNTLDWIARLNPGERIHAVIGGLHLMNASEERIEKTAEALCALDPAVVIPCHCTGVHAAEVLARTLGERVMQGGAGLMLEF